ncbi:MAG: hypothetical protein KDJ38_09785 [Gammaproteobacteria bacterium]|nr:hypothetical protein [Gammaproteobacteria bacterium]
MKYFLIFIVAVVASASSFVVHVATIEWLPGWVSDQMQGVSIQPSWDVRFIAGVTSIEYGVGAMGLYYLARNKLMSFGKVKAALLFSVLMMAIHGAIFRQPFMDYVVGNPFHVVLVQNGFKWLVWLLMSFCVVFGFEIVIKITSANKSIQLTANASAD